MFSVKFTNFVSKHKNFILILLVMSLFSACDQTDKSTALSDIDDNTIEWGDLMPEEEFEALLNPPAFLDYVYDGSIDDQIDSEMQTKFNREPSTPYEKALVSANVVSDFDGKEIRLPGFIVPLEFDENFVVTEFFLVPYFGACLHMPPPPPNQIVYVKHSEGIRVESLEQPYWVSGVLTTESEVNDMAHAAYTLTASDISLYQEEFE